MATDNLNRLEANGELQLSAAACAFRGYNVTNLGRTPEFMEIEAYRPILTDWLQRGGRAASQILQRPIDLLTRVRDQRDTDLDTYADAVVLILAVEMAQIEILERCFDIHYGDCRFAMGFSLGEVAALVASGVVEMEDALVPILSVADACVDLAHQCRLGVLFTRQTPITEDAINRAVQTVNQEGRGVVGVSTILAPNSVLAIGQQDTLSRLQAMLGEHAGAKVHLKVDPNQWPPLHTPLVWERHVNSDAARLMHTMPVKMQSPHPPVLSLLTGRPSYEETNGRDLMRTWIDHTMHLWKAVDYTLAHGVESVVHVGPAPNIIPATFRRLASNVEAQMQASIGLWSVGQLVRRPWLKAMLPEKTALLRAPLIKHVILEDWLLERADRAQAPV